MELSDEAIMNSRVLVVVERTAGIGRTMLNSPYAKAMPFRFFQSFDAVGRQVSRVQTRVQDL